MLSTENTVYCLGAFLGAHGAGYSQLMQQTTDKTASAEQGSRKCFITAVDTSTHILAPCTLTHCVQTASRQKSSITAVNTTPHTSCHFALLELLACLCRELQDGSMGFRFDLYMHTQHALHSSTS